MVDVRAVFREYGFAALLHGHVDGICVLNLDGEFIDANQAVSTLTGYSGDELKSIDFDAVIDPGYRELAAEMFGRAVAGETVRFVTKGATKEGSEFFADVTIIPLRDGGGTIVGVMGVARDVSDLHRGLAQLELSQSMIKAAGRIARFAGWSIQVPSMDLYWSDELFEILGVREPDEHFHVEMIERYYDEPYRSEIAAYLDRCIREGTPFDMVTKVRDAEGRVLDARVLGEAVRDDSGAIVRVDGAFYDITWLARQREEMARLEARMASTLNEIETPLAFVDRNWRITFANRAAQGLVGLSESQMTSGTIWEALEVSSGGLFENLCELAMEKGIAGSSVIYVERRQRYFEITAMPTTDGIVVSARDVTGEQLAAKQLDQASQRANFLARMVDFAKDAIIVTDFVEGISFWNRSAEELYGWTFEEVRGHDIIQLLMLDPQDAFGLRETVLEQGYWIGELEQRTKDGRRVTVDCTLQLIRDESGVPTGLFGVNTDVTSAKRERERSIRAQRMESIGTLAGGIAHDLNNVLAPVLMSIELLERDEDDERRLQLLGSMKASVRRGAEMIRQVLSFARGVEGARETFSLVTLLNEVHQFCRDTLPKRIDVVFEYENDLRSVEGDATQLMQVLINLITNARDAMPHGGLLVVRAYNLRQSAGGDSDAAGSRDAREVVIEVTDTGQGMDQSVASRIFEPFFTTKAFGDGTGLGLSTSLAIVKGHHGRIEVESRPGHGTTFRVVLPSVASFGESERHEAPSTRKPLHDGKGRRILVVDDEAPILMMLDEVLRQEGFDVDVAQNGEAALSTIEQSDKPYDLIITDLNMPQLSGEQLAARARERGSTPLIFMSGVYASPALVESTSEAGPFIQKPFSTNELLELINSVLT